MRHDKLKRELDLLLLLTNNRQHTVAELCQRQNISRRNLYYYLNFFRESGFHVNKNGQYYSISRNSPFFTRLFSLIQFTEDEAIVMQRLLETADADNLYIRNLKQKFNRFYDLRILSDTAYHARMSHHANVLYQAIKQQQMVIIHGYSSPHSNTVSNRLVEPFLFMNNNNDIRCYELATRINKTFKISRMEDVEAVNAAWLYGDKHRQLYTDLFMFSSEETLPVKLRFGRLSYNLLTEERPDAQRYITPDGDEHWLFEAPVCSYLGIGRFVLGLYEDIEIIGDDGFRSYIRSKIAAMQNHL